MRNLICLFGLAALCVGCASPRIHPGNLPDSLTGDGETVIQVDQSGNVSYGDSGEEPSEPSTEDAPTQTPATESDSTSTSDDPPPGLDRFLDAYEQVETTTPPKTEVSARRFDPFDESGAAPPPSTKSTSHPTQLANLQNSTQKPAAQKPAAAAQAEIPVPQGVTPSVVHSLRFELDYNDQVLGEAGMSKVEFYGTRDNGRSWTRLGEDLDRRSPFTMEMPGEGLYGFRIAVTGKNGLASRAPQNGDLPELWVKVDLSEPLFRGNLRPASNQPSNSSALSSTDGASTPSITTLTDSTTPATPAKLGTPLTSTAEPIDSQTTSQPDASAAGEESPSAADLSWNEHLKHAILGLQSELEGTTGVLPAGDAELRQQLRRVLGDKDSTGGVQQAGHVTSPPLSEEAKRQAAAQLRLLYLAAGKHEEAIKSSPHASSARNEFWSHQMLGLKLLMEEQASLSSTRQATVALAEIRDAHHKLADHADLEISNLAFCTSANSFGVYETTIEEGKYAKQDYRNRKFEPEQPVVLYFEVDNFTSDQFTTKEYPDGAWRTSLQGSYTIFTRDGRPVDRRELKLQDDTCRNRRRDYFVAYRAWIPDLPAGHYTLELLVEDKLASKIGTSSIDFEVIARR